METKFQTSFIPKKPTIVEVSSTGSSVSLFLVLSIFIFVATAMFSGFVYFYKVNRVNYLNQVIASVNESHTRQSDEITTQNLIALDGKIKMVKNIVDNHNALSNMLTELQGKIVDGIRLSSLNYTAVSGENINSLKLSGMARNFKTIDAQATVLRNSNSTFLNPVFSDFVLNNVTGAVSFSLTCNVKPSAINYKVKYEENNPDSVNSASNNTQ